MKYTLTKLLYVWYKYLVRQVHIGDWSSGMIGVSKTFGGGSIPSSPGSKKKHRKLCLQQGFRCFFDFAEINLQGMVILSLGDSWREESERQEYECHITVITGWQRSLSKRGI